ncbi:hypothetical protein FOCC_FOCC011971 [Frankliniella occidentalis]|nr:hypothetical protein FOCC_FOCC011971 [Frankliniella occidentalis]
MLKRPGFYDSLKFRFHRQKKSEENIEDIYDGSVYQQHFNGGFLSDPNNPIADSLQDLEVNGARMELPNGETFRMKAKLLGGTADMPAKSLFMRFIQFNGAFSCFYCMSQGGRYGLGDDNNNTVQVFPYNRDFELRDNDDIPEYADLAIAARQLDDDASVFFPRGFGTTTAILLLPSSLSQDSISFEKLRKQKNYFTLMSLNFKHCMV